LAIHNVMSKVCSEKKYPPLGMEMETTVSLYYSKKINYEIQQNISNSFIQTKKYLLIVNNHKNGDVK
jgi:hypothetical protein